MKNNRKKIIKLLDQLNEIWTKELQLFASNGSLELIDYKTGLVIQDFPDIFCDGGEPGYQYDDSGNAYMIR
jgi:hypothetical protein